MRWWKLLGLAGIVAVVGTGAVVAQRRRADRSFVEYEPDEIRDRLRERLAEAEPEA